MKSNDFVKYLTVQLVERIDKPKASKKSKKNKNRSLSTHWFGIIPISLKLFLKRSQKKS